jgi:hypothetical protein
MSKFGWLFFISAVYAVLRYVVFGSDPLINLPAYLINKAIALTAAFCYCLAAWNHRQADEERRRFWGGLCGGSAFMHILLSLSILSKSYYPKFFGLERLNLVGESMILFGALTACCFFAFSGAAPFKEHLKELRVFGGAFLGIHLIAAGWGGWLTPQKWNGGLPPISLISFVLVVAGVVLYLQENRYDS